MRVQKIECKNHVLRRLIKNLTNVADALTGRPVKDPVHGNNMVKPKMMVTKKIFAIRMGIDRACSYRGRDKSDLIRATALLRSYIVNAPHQVVGPHGKCDPYFCSETKR